MKSFSLLKSIFGGKSLPDEEQRALFEELLFLTLARLRVVALANN